MGFFSWLFKKKTRLQKEVQEDSDQVIFARDEVNFHDSDERRRYVEGCLEQIAEASGEVNVLNGEYALVTSYLTDMEEIEALPENDRGEVDRIAGKLQGLEREIQGYRDNPNRMPNAEYFRIRSQEEEIEGGIKKLRESENYAVLVKKDLKRLNAERSAYAYRKAELSGMLVNYKGMATIFVTAFAALMVILLILQFVLEKDAQIGFFIAIASVSIALTVLGVKYKDTDRELEKVEIATNKLIQLQNKVKIRYVNNSRLLEYLHIKYNTDSAAKLQKLWEKYKAEKEERQQFSEAESKVEFYKKELVSKLSNYRVKDPDRWVNQTQALLDSREMVEIRHDLILQRQALRKQLDYNTNIAETARREVKDVVEAYPGYAAEILAMVEQYEKMYDL